MSPPYSSFLLFANGDKKLCNKYPCAEWISITLNPAFIALKAAFAKAVITSFISFKSIALGTTHPSATGTSEGAIISHAGFPALASSSSKGVPPFHGVLVPAFLPACANWKPGTHPILSIKDVIGFKASACSSVQIPRHPGVILPLASTADASAKINPVFPLAKVLKCANCQSEATP